MIKKNQDKLITIQTFIKVWKLPFAEENKGFF